MQPCCGKRPRHTGAKGAGSAFVTGFCLGLIPQNWQDRRVKAVLESKSHRNRPKAKGGGDEASGTKKQAQGQEYFFLEDQTKPDRSAPKHKPNSSSQNSFLGPLDFYEAERLRRADAKKMKDCPSQSIPSFGF